MFRKLRGTGADPRLLVADVRRAADARGNGDPAAVLTVLRLLAGMAVGRPLRSEHLLLAILLEGTNAVVRLVRERGIEPAHLAQRFLYLGAAAGPHYLRLTGDERRLVISDYFLNEDGAGKVHSEGDHKVHVARVERHNLELDPRFELNFNTAFATGPARPHGVAFK